MTDDNNNDYELINFLILGNFYVGKHSIIERFINNNFKNNNSINITSFISKKISINNRNFYLLFRISISSERYIPLPRILFRNVSIFILVFDITNENSFDDIKKFWFPQLKNAENNNFILALVGNKCDLSYKKIDDSEIINYAKSINAKYFKVSALTGEGIKELFEYLIKTFCELNDKKQNENENKIIKIEKKDMKEKKKKFFK